MALKKRDLRNDTTSSPPLVPLVGGALARRDRVMSSFANPDRLLADTRRVIGRVGQHGSEKMSVGSANPVSATQVYPTATAARVAMRARFQPTPGCFLMLSALVLPSGSTQVFSAETGWTPAGAAGELRVTVVFTGTSTSTVTFSKTLPVSGEKWAGEKQTAGAAWSALTRVEIPLIYPADAKANASDLRAYSQMTLCDVTLAHVGGVRVVDAVIQEVPYGHVRDVGVDTVYATPMSVDGSGAIVKTYPLEFPVEAKSATDPCYGTKLLADVVHRQHTSLGSILAQWSAWDETTQPVSATDAAAVSTTSLTYVSMLNPAITAWAAANPGWSLSSGGAAQQYRTSNSGRVMRDKNAVVPVRVWAWCFRTGTGTSTLRLQSGNAAIAEVSVSSSTEGWRSGTGYLRCGLGPEDPSVLVLLGKSTGGSSVSVRHLIVEYLDLP